jgi:hypothetical protein
MSTDRKTLKAILTNVDFPASKEELVSHADEQDADSATLQALRGMPPANYANLTEVERSVSLDKASEEGQTSSDKAKQARQTTKDALAEHETEVPANPIVEELGENRGS